VVAGKGARVIGFLRALRRRTRGNTAGLFFAHVHSERIDAHYRRLVAESGHLVAWRFAFNPDNQATPIVDFPYPSPRSVMPQRFLAMLRNGGVQNGLMDMAIIPCVLALNAEYVWVVEYDVDFSGHWSRLFEQFTASNADLLTTTIAPKAETAQWYHWRHARAPATVSEAASYRAFHPVMRISRRFAEAYSRLVADPAWQGHYEFTLPTAAAAGGFVLEDIGGSGPFVSPERRNRNYVNNSGNGFLCPGTFLWRPSRPSYFHEAPAAFEQADKLYHPIKTGIADWETPRRQPVMAGDTVPGSA
jgi:hypothetical protein